MKSMRSTFAAIATLAALSACDEIFETDISGKRVAVIAPADGAGIVGERVSFRWSALDGADGYRVTVVSPDFGNARTAVADTVLYRDSLSVGFGFSLRLAPADYRWSIRAFNSAYESITSVYGLTVTAPEGPPQENEQETPGEDVTKPERR